MNKQLRKLYEELPARYELVNSIMTLGMDAYWRRKTINLALKRTENKEADCLDLCCGTGDMVALLRQMGEKELQVVGADYSPQMLQVALSKIIDGAFYTIAAANELPFPDNSFDLVTMSFATRNVKTSKQALLNVFKEIMRVLKPGGSFVTVETSQPRWAFIRFFFHLYVRLIVTPVGYLLSGVRQGYSYLTSSILSFYSAQELAELLNESGFYHVGYEELLFGGVAIHWGEKKD